jgi:tRNA uridine 5-carboxymethylaminomethyl modification enzyme
MTYYNAGECDVAVIGAGHAGIEAALAAARLGMRTILFTINMDAVGNMPCNPAIGGTGKGHLVRELDALGGEMGVAADRCCIQYRMLNRGKGPAVHSLRAQADRRRYQEYMKQVLEQQEGLQLKQAQIVEVLTENGAVSGVKTQLGAIYDAKAVIIASGTYLDSTIVIGESVQSAGPDGMHASVGLAENLRQLGLPCAGSRPAHPLASTAAASIFPRWSCSLVTKFPNLSLFARSTPWKTGRYAT